jgi:Zinc finger, C2H2 type.
LANHIKDKHQDIICKPCPECDYTCNICGYKAKDAADLTMHVYEKHNKTMIKHNCPFCNYEANNEDELKQHILTVHLKPCKLREFLRKSLGCPIEKLK